MASTVELPPVPAMMGMRLAVCSTAILISSQCSSTVTVGDSPVVPTMTMPSVPSAMCQSMSFFRPGRSRLPSACMGVTIATMLPWIMMLCGGKLIKGTIVADSRALGALAPLLRLQRPDLAVFAIRPRPNHADALDHCRPGLAYIPIFIRQHAQAAAEPPGLLQQFARLQQEVRIGWLAEAAVTRC